MNNETVGEAVERIAKLKYGSTIYGIERVNAYIDGAYLGAKLMQEKMFSKEDIMDAWEMGVREGLPLTRKKKENLFKQFKKK